MKARALLILGAMGLVGCTTGVPDELARTVLVQELPSVEGIAGEAFLACVAIDSRDADAEMLKVLRDANIDAVAGSECQWSLGGSFHRASGRKAVLVNVYGYKRKGTIEFEARHHGKYGTFKTFEVVRGPSGWKIVRTLQFMMAGVEPTDATEARSNGSVA